jgi:hypothetical protein
MRRIAGYFLWLGHVGDARDWERLHATGIVAVVDLARNVSPVALPRELTYCRFPLIDGPGNPPWLLQAAIDTVVCLLRADVPTLVFCGAGMSRSPCIAGVAIASVRPCSAAEGLAQVLKSGRSDVSPGLWSDVQAMCPEDPE